MAAPVGPLGVPLYSEIMDMAPRDTIAEAERFERVATETLKHALESATKQNYDSARIRAHDAHSYLVAAGRIRKNLDRAVKLRERFKWSVEFAVAVRARIDAARDMTDATRALAIREETSRRGGTC